MNRLPLPLTVAPFVFGLVAIAGAEDAVTFDPTYTVGKRYHLEQTVESSMAVQMGEMKMDQKSEMVTTLSLTALAGEGDTKRVVGKTERVRANVNMLGQELTYDSADPDGSNSLVSGIFGSLMGEETALVFDEDDNFVKSEASAKPAPPKQGGGLGAMMGGGGMASGQIERFAKDFVHNDYPPEAQDPGAKWETVRPVEVPQIGTLTTSVEHTFVGFETPEGATKDLARVDFEGTISTGSGEAKAGSTSIGVKGGTMKGSYFYDPAERVVRRADIAMTMAVTMNNGETAMDIPTTNNSSVVLTEIEDL